MAQIDHEKLDRAGLLREVQALTQRVHELQDQTRAEREAEERYRALVEGSSDFIYVLDRDGHFTFANQEVQRLLGFAPEALIGKHFSEVLHPLDVETLGRAFHERRTGERASKRVEVRLHARSGETRDVEMDIRHFAISASGLYRGQDYVGTHGVARDVTERRYYETKSRALHQVREAVWNMVSSDDIHHVLAAIRAGLDTMRMPFHHCGVNIVDMGEPPVLHNYSSYESSGITKRGEWMVSDTEPYAATVVEIWHAGDTAYRRNLAAEDTFGERDAVTDLYGPVDSIVDVPFSHGTLTVNSTNANAFLPRDLSFLEELAAVLSEGFRRMDDLEQLGLSERRYRTLVETPNFVVMLLDAESNYLYVSPQIEDWLGYAPDEFYENPDLGHQIVHPDDPEAMQVFQQIDQASPRRDLEYRWRNKGGHYRWASGSIFPIYEDPEDELINRVSMVQVVVQDITERKEGEERIRASLAEKEVLLKEIHHRVKNNLQIVSSLLHLQTRDLEDSEVIAVFDDSQHRIRSMALIHEELYKSEDLTRIDFARYIGNLTENLLESYGVDPGSISLELRVDDVLLGIDTAIPLGLIINELISNALKHAFPGDRQGRIWLTLSPGEDERFELTVSDDGIGMPDAIDLANPQSLGLRLVNTLAAQLRSKVLFERANGTRFTIARE